MITCLPFSSVVSFGVLCLLHCYKQSYPLNIALLAVWTTCIAFNVAALVGVLHHSNMDEIVALAALATALTFGSITAYAFVSKTDFNFLGGFLFASLLCLCLAPLVQLFVFPLLGLDADVGELAYATFGAITFSGYILYDTHRIQKVYGVDDYIAAAIGLYLDIINLFIYIIRILLKLKKKD